MTYSIPLLVPSLPSIDALLPRLKEIDENQWYTNFGPLVNQLEKAFIKYFQARQTENLYLTTVSSGTMGLELALAALELPVTARILVPAFTFVATTTAIVRTGYQPVFADINKDNWMLTPSIALQALQEISFDAVIPVATFGCPQKVTAWEAFYAKTGIPVIIDAAAGFGNQKIGQNILTVFSLHATKTFGIGEGGIVASGNLAKIQLIRTLSNFGICEQQGIKYLHGTNAKMSEYHAAVGLTLFDQWQARQVYYKQLHQQYISAISQFCPLVRLQKKPNQGIYATFSVLLPEKCDNQAVAHYLNQQEIATRFWYSHLLESTLLSNYQQLDLTNSHYIAKHSLGLPFHLFLDGRDIFYICHHLAKIITTTLDG